jgi:hypothetical protein
MYLHSPKSLHDAVIKHSYSLSSTNFGYWWEICGSWARELTGSEIMVVILAMLIRKLDTYLAAPMNNPSL